VGRRSPRWRRVRRRGGRLGRFESFALRGRPSFAGVSDVEGALVKVYIPVVVAGGLTMRANHGADVDAGTGITHLTVRICSCSPESSFAWKLLDGRVI
jgi:hypothetical protein